MNAAKSGVELPQCDGMRVAIIWHAAHGRRIFRGTARYVRGTDGENSLWIKPENLGSEDGDPEFIISERQWDGEIVPDRGNDCDFQIDIRTGPSGL